MMCLLLQNLILLTFFLPLYGNSAASLTSRCPWLNYEGTSCPKTHLLCDNEECINRSLFCDGNYDCADRSDEKHCGYLIYPVGSNSCDSPKKIRCEHRCIPEEWICDDIVDCIKGEDEANCDFSNSVNIHSVLLKAVQWLYNQSKPESVTEVWGSLVDKAAIALYFADDNFTSSSNGARKQMAHEVSIQFLSRLFRTKLQDISSNDLASFLNAFLVTCIDPRKFHGIDIVEELRNRVDKENYTNPYVMLSLCNAGEKITESDKVKLIQIFWNKRRAFWTDIQALAIMALSCASKQSENEGDIETLHELTRELKQLQYRNGSVENLRTTALVLQALISAEANPDANNFDEWRAWEQILSSQKPDGSFGNLIKTYFVLPVLSCKSLMDISSDHCKFGQRDEMSALVDLANRAGPKKRVQYSLWIGEEKDLERNLVLRVPQNMSLYGIMEIAAEIDNRYRFQYVVKSSKPYIIAISEFQDNPEKGKFWFLYVMKDGQPTPAQESPVDVMPVDNDHFVLWYRSGSWID